MPPGFAVQSAMWTAAGTVQPPSLDNAPGFGQGNESMLTETLIPQAAIEPFHETVICRLAGRLHSKHIPVFASSLQSLACMRPGWRRPSRMRHAHGSGIVPPARGHALYGGRPPCVSGPRLLYWFLSPPGRETSLKRRRSHCRGAGRPGCWTRKIMRIGKLPAKPKRA